MVPLNLVMKFKVLKIKIKPENKDKTLTNWFSKPELFLCDRSKNCPFWNFVWQSVAVGRLVLGCLGGHGLVEIWLRAEAKLLSQIRSLEHQAIWKKLNNVKHKIVELNVKVTNAIKYAMNCDKEELLSIKQFFIDLYYIKSSYYKT